MNIRLVDKNNNIFDLPSSWDIRQSLPESNSIIEKNILIDGGQQTGDLSIKSRQLEILGHFKNDGVDDVNDKVDELLEFIFFGQPCKLFVNGYNSKYALLYYNKGSFEPIVFKEVGKVSIMFDMPYPYWIDDTPIQVVNNGITNGSQFTITTATKPIKPVIKIKALGTLSDLTITNTSYNYMYSRVFFPGFLVNTEIEIDCKNGTVKRVSDGLDIKKYFEGSFLTLIRGANVLEFLGSSSSNITITYNKEFFR